MDFGMMGVDGVIYSDSVFATSLASDPETNQQKWYGSGFLKQERSGINEDVCRELKVAKYSDDFSTSKAMLLQQRSSLMRSNNTFLSDGQQMLSFSSSDPQTVSLPCYHHTSSAYARNTGYGSAGLNAVSMQGVLTGVRGPFTPSQWMELEHQALIYKYITANVPIPSHLLIPIRKALDSAGFSTFSGLRPDTLGWSAFHLGFSNNTDPEPGRCRRTDGKKWRCSKDAVTDQKYCERHMNRGRHRSRKPVEGQTGHSVSGHITTGKLMPMTSSASVVPVSGGSNTLGFSQHHQLTYLQPGAPNPSPSLHLNGSFLNKEDMVERNQDTSGLSMLSPTIGLKGTRGSITKQQNMYENPPRMGFGIVSSGSLLSPLHRNSGSSEDLNDCETKSGQSVRQFMDNWPKKQTERSVFSWPDNDLQADRTQLSISIPMASDFMSSTSSPTTEKLALRLSRELEPTNEKQANWIPISWETSMGGPLGEVLHSNNQSALNLMTKGWGLASSPTGVLQKTTFRSLSNSSAGSSPRRENIKIHEGSSLYNNLLGSTLANPSL